MSEPVLLIATPRDGTSVITLNRPRVRNAIDVALAAAWSTPSSSSRATGASW
jgi:enoyl-CoA hydratase/carnithine racemase